MKITDLIDLFIGYSYNDDFRVLIHASNIDNAKTIADRYAAAMNLDTMDVIPLNEDHLIARFNCDHILSLTETHPKIFDMIMCIDKNIIVKQCDSKEKAVIEAYKNMLILTDPSYKHIIDSMSIDDLSKIIDSKYRVRKNEKFIIDISADETYKNIHIIVKST